MVGVRKSKQYKFTNWVTEEPNDGPGPFSEDWGAMRSDPENQRFGEWNDWSSQSYDYYDVPGIIETPEPGTLALLLFGGLAVLRRRR